MMEDSRMLTPLDPSALPKNVIALRTLLLHREDEHAAELQQHVADLIAARNGLQEQVLRNEQLKLRLARLLRERFGASSERLRREIEQLELLLGESEEQVAEATPPAPDEPAPASEAQRHKPARKPLPATLPRDVVEHAAPSLPIHRGLAGPGLLAHVLVAKYADHLPLYRQAEIYARAGIDLDRSTLADWVGGASRTLQPLVDALRKYVLSAEKLHGDDVPVPVLEPGNGKTKTGRLWTYVRDDRPSGSEEPAAVWFAYSPDRKGEHPARHLEKYAGVLQADGYAGFN